MPKRIFKRLVEDWQRVQDLVPQSQRRHARVSSWSIGQHVDHLVRAHRGILGFFADPPTGEPTSSGITWLGRVSLLTGFIPRGRGKAPAATLPETDAVDLVPAVTQIRGALANLADLPANVWNAPIRFPHPVFGGLDRRQWLHFLDVHQRHHLAIIRDILRGN